MSFSVDDYYPPQWSAMPSHSYYFEIIKDGNLLGKIQIKEKEFSLIGRLQDLCDIYIDNPLVSRKHAVLQAKQNDAFLYLMDLGSQHGTFVNKVKLPVRTYKKLQPFDSVKFGVSSRVYILRCPQCEKMKEMQESQKDNEFAKMIQEQNRQVSKEQLKAKYLDMLQNDPYFAASQGPRTLQGRANQPEDQYQGIDWGIDDEREIYAYKNDNDMPIEPDLLRRLNLDSLQLNKLSQYEQLLRKYQETESELNEITSKQKKEYGLEQKLQGKKQKLQKRFVEALESLQKCEDWLRVNIFGQAVDRNKNSTFRERQNDTFGDDIFLDRTLQKNQTKKVENEQIFQAESYWALQSKLKSQLQQLQNIREKLKQYEQQKQLKAIEKNEEDIENQEDGQEDELDLFMKQNNMDADESNLQIFKREQSLYQQSIKSIRQKLQNIVGEAQVQKIISDLGLTTTAKTLKDSYLQKSIQQRNEQMKIKMQENKNIQDILNKIESAQRNEDEIDQDNVQIFKYYKERAALQEEEYVLDEEKDLEKLRNQRRAYDPTAYEKPSFKIRKTNEQTLVRINNEKYGESQQGEQQVIDLTRQFK